MARDILPNNVLIRVVKYGFPVLSNHNQSSTWFGPFEVYNNVKDVEQVMGINKRDQVINYWKEKLLHQDTAELRREQCPKLISSRKISCN